jgi:hypothetical protein
LGLYRAYANTDKQYGENAHYYNYLLHIYFLLGW